jgi:hypothetical protein
MVNNMQMEWANQPDRDPRSLLGSTEILSNHKVRTLRGPHLDLPIGR